MEKWKFLYNLQFICSVPNKRIQRGKESPHGPLAVGTDGALTCLDNGQGDSRGELGTGPSPCFSGLFDLCFTLPLMLAPGTRAAAPPLPMCQLRNSAGSRCWEPPPCWSAARANLDCSLQRPPPRRGPASWWERKSCCAVLCTKGTALLQRLWANTGEKGVPGWVREEAASPVLVLMLVPGPQLKKT